MDDGPRPFVGVVADIGHDVAVGVGVALAVAGEAADLARA